MAHLELTRAVQTWAEKHPAPDGPAIRIPGKGGLSPRQVADEVQRTRCNLMSPAGYLLLQVLENAV